MRSGTAAGAEDAVFLQIDPELQVLIGEFDKRKGAAAAPRVLMEEISHLREESLLRLPDGEPVIDDPFGLAHAEVDLVASGSLLVYPRLAVLDRLFSESGAHAQDGRRLLLRRPSGFDLHSVREYEQGESLRKVHWRSTARRDELMVRVEERPWRGGTTLLLDHRVHAHRGSGPTASLEWAISFVASICLHLHHFGHQVRLVSEDGRVLAFARAVW